MDKKTAIKLLGGTPAKAARALGYATVQAIYVWPDPLPLGLIDRINGAALRLSRAKVSRSSGPKRITTQASV